MSPDVPHDELIQEYNIDAEGYVFMYVSNNSPLKVYFDDVTFTHTPTNVIQYNEYYPFGLQTINSWTRDNNRNDYLYNAGSELNATSGWYETFFRGYDPTLGRFLQVDPLAAKYGSNTPYNFANNNPVLLSDPTGADAVPDGIPDWVDYRMGMIRMYTGGRSTTELQMRRSQQRWSESAMSLETFLAATVPSGSHGGHWRNGNGLLYRHDNEVGQYFKFQEYHEVIDRGNNWYGVEDGIPVGRYGWTVGIRLVPKLDQQNTHTELDSHDNKWGSMMPVGIIFGAGVDAYVGGGGTVGAGGVIITRGPDAGKVVYFLDHGVGLGLDLSAVGQIGAVFYTGDAGNFTKTSLIGERVSISGALGLWGVNGFITPSDATNGRVIGIQGTYGPGINPLNLFGASVPATGNINFGRTDIFNK